MATRRLGRSMTKMGRAPKCFKVAPCRCALIVMAVAGAGLTNAACGATGYAPTGYAPTSNHSRAHAQTNVKPRVLSVRYGKFRPAGAPRAYTALEIKARIPEGQMIGSVAYQQLDPPGGGGAAIADSACGLGGKRNGQSETFTFPIKRRPGSHRFRVTVESSPCRKPGRPRSTSRTFTVLA